ncbi:DsbA family protein [Micromonospora sp. DT233]|uniref:DsbA family protein n=1 Tax=Micromonospora sp. DT233 TaxID=3393432 RepID=UPI003CEA129A
MLIEVWADVVCAWAYIGKRRLERALAGWSGPAVRVQWLPYRIDPTAPATAEPLDEALRDPVVDGALRHCAPGLSPAENRVRVSRIAAEEGLGPRWGAAWRTSSHDAHRLIAAAYRDGGPAAQDAVVERVLRAHFVEAADIGDPATLAGIARAAGIAPLPAGAGDTELRELLLRGRAVGVRTSPTLVVGGRALAGAQPPEVIAQFLHAAAGDPPRRVPPEVQRLRQAESLLDQGDPLGALTLLDALLSAHGDDRGVRLLAARAYVASASLGRARAALERLVAEEPGDAYLRLLLGRVLRRQGHPEQAAGQLRLAAAMAPAYD